MQQKMKVVFLPTAAVVLAAFFPHASVLYRFLLALASSFGLYVSIFGTAAGACRGEITLLLVPVLAFSDALFCILFYYVRKLGNYAAAFTSALGAFLFLFLGAHILAHFGWILPPSQSFYFAEGLSLLAGGLLAAFLQNRKGAGV